MTIPSHEIWNSYHIIIKKNLSVKIKLKKILYLEDMETKIYSEIN